LQDKITPLSPLIFTKSGRNTYVSLESRKTLNVGTFSFSTNYDINDVSDSKLKTIILSAQANRYSNLPSFVHAENLTDVGFIQLAGYNVSLAMQVLHWFDSNFEGHIAIRTINTRGVNRFSDWVELTGGGAQIVSGVVNQNGTITFTDSDGNTFATSGSKLVTSGSEQISIGYDNGGFYFLFDDGQEAS
jgi:hypothetical protein